MIQLRLLCDGRDFDHLAFRLQGDACDSVLDVPNRERWFERQLVESARAAGWSVGSDGSAMCPRCRKARL